MSHQSFEVALHAMRRGYRARRDAWKPNKHVSIEQPADRLSYLEIRYDDGRRAPWTPTRCDLLEIDWSILK